ncbi:hypothetical protein Poli38472_013912 [Pythium oligandrum]|uniref:C2 domain-containing protein n=1 Tax=Pythium oligandrum TaxID=41045 RepID=A0A8K1C2B4_PYTOL|nr:hypothetical protein Poli38472_013912 [Pythium oligandrum]|eukprot:TMW55150.1 hypothetical protein Poli38472_013912 [Pythium oligandrum]
MALGLSCVLLWEARIDEFGNPGLAPVWNQEFSFQAIDPQMDQLHVKVKNTGFTSSTLIGESASLSTCFSTVDSQGSFLYRRTAPQHLTLVAAKSDVPEIPYDRVTEAFGVENWPHLLHSLEDGDEVLKKRVLLAMSTVFKLPQDLIMCLKIGVLEHIEQGILDENQEIRELSALVLSVILESPLGRSHLMTTEMPAHILPVLQSSTHPATMLHLYNALLSLSRVFTSAQLLTKHGYLTVVVTHLKRSLSDELRLRVLQLLKNLVNDGIEGTVFKAIELDSLDLCAKYLYDANAEISAAACDTIAALGYVEKAKKIAVERGAVKKLCTLLTESQWQIVAASTGALMCLAVNDDAKRVMVASEALHTINQLLQSSKYIVQLNTVKLVSIVASYPPARRQLNVSSTEYHLRSLMGDSDAVLAKSAKIALRAVQWQP